MSESLTFLHFLFLAIAAFFAGFIDAIAGGGGLISLPSLLAAGIPPHIALATNKVQSALGTTFSAFRYVRNGYVFLPIASIGFGAAFTGSFAGAWTVMQIPGSSLEAIIPGLIVVVGIVTFIRKNFGAEDRFNTMQPRYYAITIVFAFSLGFYDGFFGPGTGSFLAFGYILLFRFGFVRATGNAKLTNLASNYAAIIAFVLGGHVVWTVALVMGLANICGAWMGAGFAMRSGVRLIKPAFGIVLLGLLMKIMFFN